MAAEHELKTWPRFFEKLLSGEKTFEARRDDRGFRAGDTLWLREWSPENGYSGRDLRVVVTYLLCGPAFGVESGFAVMGFESPTAARAALEECKAINLYTHGENMAAHAKFGAENLKLRAACAEKDAALTDMEASAAALGGTLNCMQRGYCRCGKKQLGPPWWKDGEHTVWPEGCGAIAPKGGP